MQNTNPNSMQYREIKDGKIPNKIFAIINIYTKFAWSNLAERSDFVQRLGPDQNILTKSRLYHD